MLHEPWRITLCGGLSARQGTRVVDRFRTQKTGLLLAYLALHAERTHGREELAELFWPESERPLHSLSMALGSLRQQLEPPGVGRGQVLRADRSHIGLVRGTVHTDVEEFRTAVAKAARADDAAEKLSLLRRGVEAISGELLPGSYPEWALQARDLLTQQMERALKELVGLLTADEEPEAALPYALRRAHLGPLNEEATISLMDLLLHLKRPAEALQHFQRLTMLLQEEVGVGPSSEARALAASAGRPVEDLLPTGASPMVCSALSAEPASARRLSPSTSVSVPTASASRPVASVPPAPVFALPTVRLPLPLTPFFGREAELTRLCFLLGASAPTAGRREGFLPASAPWRPRVVTVLGMGGSGKTRLAIEAGRACAAAARDRAVCFVGLADADTREQVVQSIAEAVCPTAPTDGEPLQRILSTLGEAAWLLILDNVEQVTEASAVVVGDLLQRLPGLTCLVTSRQRLDIYGERELSLLPLPTPEYADSPECLLEFASVQLFVDRAQAANADFQLTVRNAASVAALCRRLEGLPLALELAASWAQTLSPAQMLARLDRRFDLLRARRRGMATRHQALETCIAWSYRLLSPDLQNFFCRLCLLRGEWTLETAEIMADDAWTLDHLQRLREASFLLGREEQTTAGTALHFHILETLRDFGLEQLTPEEIDAGYERLVRDLIARTHSYPVAIIDRENMRAAVDWCRCSAVGHGLELALLNALTHFWSNRGAWAEGRRWLQEALGRSGTETTRESRKAWNTLGFLHAMLHERGEAKRCFAQALADAEQAGDAETSVRALNNLATIAAMEGEHEAACALTERNRGLADRLGDVRAILTLLNTGGSAHASLGRTDKAREYFEEALCRSREAGLEGYAALCLSNLADIAHKEGDRVSAQKLYEKSLEIFRRVGEEPRVAAMLSLLAEVMAEQGDLKQSRIFSDESEQIRLRLQGE